MDSEPLKPVRWVGSSQRDVRSFPRSVKLEIGHAPYTAQRGQTDPAKPMKGFGSGALEIVADLRGDTWRAVYTVRFEDAVYCAARFPEEIEAGHCDAEKGTRSYPETAGGRATGLQRKAELK